MAAAKSILVVNADREAHRTLSELIAGPERQLESAYDGLEALLYIQSQPFDLVVTDIRLPGIDGLDLLRCIWELRPETRVMVIGGASAPEHVLRSIRHHAFAYFSEPFDPRSVKEMITHALDSPDWAGDIHVLSATPQWIRALVRCKVSAADRLLQFLREIKMDLPPKAREDLGMAFREMIMNAFEYGCNLDPDQWIQIGYVRARRFVICYVRDPGTGFSLEGLVHSAIANPADSPAEHVEVRESAGMRPGGFGILLTRNLVDELLYNDKGNEVLLIKYLDEPSE